MRRDEAAAAVEELCPRCGARREPDQEFCLECGFRLPSVTGRVPSLRRRWLRGLGWYPGDWVWISALTFLVAAAGAAVSIAATTSGGGSGNGSTVVAPPPPPATTTAPPPPPPTTTTVPTTTARTTTARTTTTTPAPPPPATTTTAANGKFAWPAGEDGWTNVLESFPVSGGLGAPQAVAAQAVRRGLPQVGVLDSSRFSSLHPGYYVVFSGFYATSAEADAALSTAHVSGFSGAYSRQIAQ